MYKKQLTVQKILCMAAVIVSAVVFFYALGIMTDLYDALYDTMRNPNDVFQTDVPGFRQMFPALLFTTICRILTTTS